MILAFWLLAVQPQDLPCFEAVETTAPVIVGAYDIDPEEIEAESTGGTY